MLWRYEAKRNIARNKGVGETCFRRQAPLSSVKCYNSGEEDWGGTVLVGVPRRANPALKAKKS